MNYRQLLNRNLTQDEIDYNLESLKLRLQTIGVTMPVTLRRDLTRPLTNRELDANFQSLDQYTRQVLYGEGPYPVFDQSFAGAHFLDPRITLTRPGPSAYIDDEGVLRTAAIDEPVFENGAWRLEPQGTNLALWSEDFTKGVWLRSRTIVSGVGASPLGAAYKVSTSDTAAISKNIFQEFTGLSSGRHTTTIGVAPAEISKIRFATYDGIQERFAFIDLANKQAGATSGIESVKIEPAKEGWLRVDIVHTIPAGRTHARVQVNFCNDDWELIYAGNIGDGVLLTAAQLNVGDPIPYIPTTTSQITRPADNAGIFGDAFQSVFNPSEGAIVWGISAVLPTDDNNDICYVCDETNVNHWYFTFTPTGEIYLGAKKDGVGVTVAVASYPALALPAGGKVALAWDSNGLGLFYGGVKHPNVATPDEYGISAFDRISDLTGVGKKYRRLSIYRTRPSDAKLVEYTS